MNLEWSSKIATGISEIDQQHKRLFDMLNSLMLAVDNCPEDHDIKQDIIFLERYVMEHFDTEEDKMKLYSYPALAEHITQHRIFTDSLNDLKRRYLTQGASRELLLMIQSSLCNWLFKHIMCVDKEMGEFLVKHTRAQTR